MTTELIAAQYLSALDTLQHARSYVNAQYRDEMTREQAQSHFGARAILLNASARVHNEAMDIWDPTGPRLGKRSA